MWISPDRFEVFTGCLVGSLFLVAAIIEGDGAEVKSMDQTSKRKDPYRYEPLGSSE
jgi:hypothetical protein